MRTRRRTPGFSLIELMMTVAVVGILAAIAVPSWGTLVAKARQIEGKSGLLAVHTLQIAHHAERGTYGTLDEIGFVTEGAARYAYKISNEQAGMRWGGGGGLDAGTGIGSDARRIDGLLNGWSADDDDGGGIGFDPAMPSLGNPHHDADSFECIAIGIISAAPAPNDVDVWSIDHTGQLENINPGY